MKYIKVQQLSMEASQSLNEVMGALERTHRLFNSGILFEADLESAINDLQSSAQAGMDKVDEAVNTVKNFQAAFRNVAKKDGPKGNVFSLLLVGANKSLEDLNKLANLDLGFSGGFTAFFKDGGKYAAAIDALETHMKVFDRFTKTIGQFMAQLARTLQTIPDPVREKYNSPDSTMKDLLADPEVKKKVSEKQLKKALKAAIKAVEDNAGDAGFSMKGIKNMFTKFSGSAGLAALGAGALALGPAAGALGLLAIGKAGKSMWSKIKENPFSKYGLSHSDVIDSVMETSLFDINEGLPQLVQALKGMKVVDKITKIKTDMVKIQNNMGSVDASQMMKPYFERLQGPNKKKWLTIANKFPEETKQMFSSFMAVKDAQKKQAYYDIGFQDAQKVFAEARFISDYEEILHENSLVENLFDIDHKIEDIHLL